MRKVLLFFFLVTHKNIYLETLSFPLSLFPLSKGIASNIICVLCLPMGIRKPKEAPLLCKHHLDT